MKLILSLLFLIPVTSSAFENLGSVSTSLGGAGAGSINIVDGAINNPASFAMFDQRSAVLNFARNSTRATLSDNGADALFPAMIGYHQSDIDNFKTKSFVLGLAYLISKSFSVGVNFNFNEYDVMGFSEKYRQNVADVGAMFKANEWFSVGAVLKNKPMNDTELSDMIDDRPTTAVGFQINQEFFNLRGELESGKNAQSDQKTRVKGGFDVMMNQWLQLRLGYQNDNIASQNYLTSGLGFGGPQFGLHYSYIKESEFQKETYHSIDLAVPF
jgi:hypothetical protein